MARLTSRLAQIERANPPAPIVDESAKQRRGEELIALFDELLGTMAPKHAQIVIDDLQAGRFYRSLFRPEPDHASNLTRVAIELVRRRLAKTYDWERPMALPPEAAELYVMNERAVLGPYDCEACGFETPSHHNNGHYLDAHPEVPHHLPICPLCGGRVGYASWKDAPYRKRQAAVKW